MKVESNGHQGWVKEKGILEGD